MSHPAPIGPTNPTAIVSLPDQSGSVVELFSAHSHMSPEVDVTARVEELRDACMTPVVTQAGPAPGGSGS